VTGQGSCPRFPKKSDDSLAASGVAFSTSLVVISFAATRGFVTVASRF